MRYVHVALAALAAGACSDSSPVAPLPRGPVAPVNFALSGGATGAIASTFAIGKCMDVTTGISNSPGARLQIWSCSGGVNQQFTWTAGGALSVYDGTMCIDANGTSDGAAVIINACAGTASQTWTATGADEVRGSASGKCIDITGIGSTDGTPLQLWTCSGGKNQQWSNSGGTSPTPTPTPNLPTPTVPTPTDGFPIAPGQSIQAAVDANPAGATFLIKAGTHVRQTVVPKAGDVFNGEPGAVLDGQGATTYAFRGWTGSAWVNNVTIRGLTVTGYNPSAQNGAISAGNAPGDATSGWAIDNVDVSYNQQYGIRIGDNMRVTNSRLHHNDVLNISGGGNNVLVEGNEIAYGNFRNSGSANFESGGTKFVLTDGFVARNNYVHDNVGVGLWIDEGNINYLLENNRVENNGSEGIALEISYRGVVRNNIVFNNGWKDPRARTWMWNAGIGVHATSDVEVYGNTVGGNMNGIVAIQQARGAGRFGQYLVSNLYVHDNTVTQTTIPPPFNPSAAGGAVTDNGDAGLFTRNNRWVHNTYFTGANGHPFEWQGSWRTSAEWRALGQDGDGTFNY